MSGMERRCRWRGGSEVDVHEMWGLDSLGLIPRAWLAG